jgi:hypothetical protein
MTSARVARSTRAPVTAGQASGSTRSNFEPWPNLEERLLSSVRLRQAKINKKVESQSNI